MKLKCKSIWAREGDVNTTLFHRLLSARRTRNTISKLETEEGAIFDDEEEITKKIVEFYEKLYESPRGKFIGVQGLEWNLFYYGSRISGEAFRRGRNQASGFQL